MNLEDDRTTGEVTRTWRRTHEQLYGGPCGPYWWYYEASFDVAGGEGEEVVIRIGGRRARFRQVGVGEDGGDGQAEERAE